MLNLVLGIAFVAVLVGLILRRRSKASEAKKPTIGRLGVNAKTAKARSVGRGPSIGRRL
jgi:hypothetical protein